MFTSFERYLLVAFSFVCLSKIIKKLCQLHSQQPLAISIQELSPLQTVLIQDVSEPSNQPSAVFFQG